MRAAAGLVPWETAARRNERTATPVSAMSARRSQASEGAAGAEPVAASVAPLGLLATACSGSGSGRAVFATRVLCVATAARTRARARPRGVTAAAAFVATPVGLLAFRSCTAGGWTVWRAVPVAPPEAGPVHA